MPGTDASSRRGLLNFCGFCGGHHGKHGGQSDGSEQASRPAASLSPQGKLTVPVPPHQVSARSIISTNPSPTGNEHHHDDSVRHAVSKEQSKPPGSSSSEATPPLNKQQEGFKQLWVEAINEVKGLEGGEKIEAILQTQESCYPKDTLLTLPGLITTLQEQMKRVGVRGKMADTMEKIIPHLNRFAIIGDIAVSANPNPAALPWAAVRFILLNLTAGDEIRAKVIEGIANITILEFECGIYYELFLSSSGMDHPPTRENLRQNIVKSFVSCLIFLGFALRRQRDLTRGLTDAFKLPDFTSYLEGLDKAKHRLHDAGILCDLYDNSQNRAQLTALHDLVIEMRQESSEQSEQSVKEQLSQFLRDPNDAFDHIPQPYDSFCLDATRKEVLRDIHQWANSNGPNICWLPGLAGTGKSTIARTIARDFKGKILGASFFFKKGASNRASGKHLFSTIAYQLALNLPPVRKYMIDAFKEDASLALAPMDLQWKKLVQTPLVELRDDGFPKQVVLVVDGLDECDEADRAEVLRLLVPSCPTILKLFITSRPELDIEAYFSSSEPLRREIVLHRVKVETVAGDIGAFLKHVFANFVSNYNKTHKICPLRDDWPGSDNLQILTKRSAPLFIAAATYIRMIGNTHWNQSPDDKIAFIVEKSGHSNSALEELYASILSLILIDAPKDAHETAIDGFVKIIGSVVLLSNPLSVLSLARLLEVGPREVMGQVDPLRSVLDVPSSNSPVKLFHLSFRDYLLSPPAGRFRIYDAKGHGYLAERCVELLEAVLKSNICGLGSPGASRLDLDPRMIESQLTPEVQYACLNWVYHLSMSETDLLDDRTTSMLSRFMVFFRTYFLRWLEALCLIGKVVDSYAIIQELESISKKNPDDEILRFVSDARRFIGYFQPGIEDTPLQLYSSGTIFSPNASIVPQSLENRTLPDRVKRCSNVKSHWPKMLPTIKVGEGYSQQMTFLPNGRLVVMTNKKNIEIWDPNSGSCILTPTLTLGFEQSWLSGFSLWGNNTIAIGSWGQIEIWDFDSGKCIQTFALPSCDIADLAFSDDGNFICSTSRRREQRIGQIHSLGSQQRVNSFAILEDVRKCSLSPKGQWVATNTGDLIMLSKWSVDGDLQWTNLENSDGDDDMVFSMDGNLLALSAQTLTSELEHVVKVWCTRTKEQLYRIQTPPVATNLWRRLALTDHSLAILSEEEAIIVTDLRTERVSHTLDTRDVSCIAMSNDGRLLTVCEESRFSDIITWDLASTSAPEPTGSTLDAVLTLRPVSDGKTVLSLSSREINIWDVPSGDCKGTLGLDPQSGLKSLTVARNAPIFAMTQENEVKICCFNPSISMRTFETKGSSYVNEGLAISGNGERIALVSRYDSTADDPTDRSFLIEIRDVKSTQLIRKFRATDICTSSIIFSPNGTTIAYATSSIIKAFDVLGNELFSVPLDDGFHLEWSPLSFSNGYILARSNKGHVQTYDAGTGERRGHWTISGQAWAFMEDESFIRPESIHDNASSANLEIKHPWKAYYLGPDGAWLMKDKERFLWLPPDCRPRTACVSGTTIVIGTTEGRVLFLCLSDWD
ncbi:hypothetical protein NW762_014437 [Fusarium torreyae]|uniref:NACHT domain-containing protein n=1 Tax=Fusarium torreyae TaxID=1237075 RepID=A0A9W8V6L4_9HYPO|nr:hypothetical protein NW762_014437 [Fusarium torreyae]